MVVGLVGGDDNRVSRDGGGVAPYSAATLFKGVTDWYLEPRLVMSSNGTSFAVTYTSISSEAQSWRIATEDPYEEAARQALEQAPPSLEYVPDPIELEDHVPVYVPKLDYPDVTS
nr:hypothetical protein [Tanacetum cinerariifolium]